MEMLNILQACSWTHQACLVPTKSDIVHLVVRYLDSGGRGAYSAFKALTGKALYNPLTSVRGKDVCPERGLWHLLQPIEDSRPRDSAVETLGVEQPGCSFAGEACKVPGDGSTGEP